MGPISFLHFSQRNSIPILKCSDFVNILYFLRYCKLCANAIIDRWLKRSSTVVYNIPPFLESQRSPTSCPDLNIHDSDRKWAYGWGLVFPAGAAVSGVMSENVFVGE